MRVLFLSTWFPYPPDNGSKIRVYYLLRALAERHEVTTVAFHSAGNGHMPPQPIPGLEQVRVIPVYADPFRFVSLPPIAKFASPVPVSLWPAAEMGRAVQCLARSKRFDAVVGFQAPVACYALLLSGAARILDVDTALSYQMYERYTKQHELAARLRAWVSWQKARFWEGVLLRQFQVCTVVGAQEVGLLDAMVDRRASQIIVIPNGVDCEHNQPGLASVRPNTLIYNGSLTYSANYDAMRYFLAEVYPLIRRQEPGVSLTITGSTVGVDLAGLKLDDSVRLSGYLEDVRPAVASASVCVVPIRQGGGTRLKILEAMALGTPVVATSKGAEGLDVVDGEHLLLADDPMTFADRTVQLLRDPALHQRLAVNARKLVEERYDWAQIGQRFVELVEETAKRHAAKANS